MSIWQFNAALAGYAKAHAGSDNKLSKAERDELFEWIEASNDNAGRELGTTTYRWDGNRLIAVGRVNFRGD